MTREDHQLTTIMHNGRMYNVDMAKLREISPKIKSLSQKQPIQLDLSDNKYTEDIFSYFIRLVNDDGSDAIDPSLAPKLVNLIQDWEANSLISKLELRVLSSSDKSLLINYIKYCPDSFHGLRSYLDLHIDQFCSYPELFDLPLSLLFTCLKTQKLPEMTSYSFSHQYLDIYETSKELKSQEEDLNQQKLKLEAQVSQIKQKTTDLDLENQRVQKQNADLEQEIEKLKQQLQEKKKIVTQLQSNIKAETKVMQEAQKNAEKATNELNNARNRLEKLRIQYEKLQIQ
ncbi:hypothetical protein TVAG_478300 [Trichomonas vaginalis G3]|uniref:Uncharacterized protein n=1 Tax=Trichomonas vaginalis (strain ATCC PRA-98 / G3) TaxID=412133 RepID=A2DZU6_TRIV3|nr:hypothetical protein TVAGG3_0536900 [Trichomonas vaginalis G3]EAY14005.1 hypothetical protein TVAG_478300 [Trichomonas vaginalis G3]KAI5519561.1 hypothetical protein TVAGG3_0536900 [Trichomonas vaginalis G3]|eukprot:XP_001326228.1 hypothetical protein [Trichomonas vaginalis G3]